jgi:hypothetical protein
MMQRDIEKEVIDYLMEHYPVRKHWFKSGFKQVTKDWSLTVDFKFTTGEAEEMLLDFFAYFHIDYSNIDPRNYLDYAYPFWQKHPCYDIKPLTVNMLIESARAGHWLYD